MLSLIHIYPHLIKNFGSNSLRKVKSDPADARKIARYTLDNWAELRQYSGTVSYTHLDVYKRQFLMFRSFNVFQSG